MPKNFATKTTLVEVHDPATSLNQFMDLRETESAVKSKLSILKPIIARLVGRGKNKTDVIGMRDGKKGKFIVTIVPRDLREPDNDKTIALLNERGITAYKVKGEIQPAIKTVVLYNKDVLAALYDDGVIDNDTLRTLLVGTATSYPKVVFKPGQ